VRTVAAADLDRDGDLDVFAAQAGNARVRRFENRALGNYDVDSAVDGSDFLLWQRTLGQTPPFRGAAADGDGSGVIDAGDLALWRENFGWQAPSSGGGGSGIGINRFASVSAGGVVVPSDAFFATDLFSISEPAASSSALLAEQEGRYSTNPEVRDAAFADLLIAPRVRFEEITGIVLSAKFEEPALAAENTIAATAL
jgi:hypothetical protein